MPFTEEGQQHMKPQPDGPALCVQSELPCYMADYSEKRMGWCVFKGTKSSILTVEYWAGPFNEKSAAESESKRLNEIAARNIKF